MQDPYLQRANERSVHSALQDFMRSNRWKSLEDVDQESATSFLKVFLDSSHKEMGCKPEDLDLEQIRELLLNHLPKRIAAKRRGAEQAVPLVAAYYEHLEETNKDWKPPRGVKKLFKDSTATFAEILRGDRSAGESVERAEPLRRDDAKAGRNDPCPCGSGKKFKKCCMGT